MSTERTLEEVWADQVAMAEARGLTIPTKCSPELAAELREIGVEVDPEDIESDVAPVAHPGADFDVTEEHPEGHGALFAVEGGVVNEAGEMVVLDVEVDGVVDENGVVRWGGER